MLDVRDVPALPNELRAAMATWLPVMSAGVAADVHCAVSCLACLWATAVSGLAESQGFSRTTPLECLNGSIARSSCLVAWRFWPSEFEQLLFGDLAGNRRALQDNAS